jgi:hypothetical protein
MHRDRYSRIISNQTIGMDVGASDGALLGRVVGKVLGSVLGMDKLVETYLTLNKINARE